MDGTFFPQHQEQARWRADPAAYWLEAARGIDWITPPDAALHLTPDGHAGWFPGGMLNSCANALDRHVAAGRGNQTALIWESPASGAQARFTYAQLLRRVAGFAGGLRALGVAKGDRVLITMPPVPEAVIAMLACARLGAVHVVVFAGYAPAELVRRIEDTTPRVIITASCAYTIRRPQALVPGLREALALSKHAVDASIILNRPGHAAEFAPGEHDFCAVERSAPVPCVPVAAADPLYILHTSGTTGRPKGIVRDNGGHAVALHRSMALVYGIGPGEVFCTTADLGWVVGHSYAVYGPLFMGCTTVLFEGSATGTPDAGAIWRLCTAHGVNVLFTAPSALRAMRCEDTHGARAQGQDFSRLRHIFLAGERADAASLAWAASATGVPVLDHWWQTETGAAIATPLAGSGQVFAPPGSAGQAMPGFDLCVLGPEGQELPPGATGELVARLPLPPGCFTQLWNASKLSAPYFTAFPGYYRSFDHGSIDAAGHVRVISRTDDVLKIAGRRISAGQIEEALIAHPDVLECAVTSQPDALRGEVPVAFLVLRPGAVAGRALRAALIRRVHSQIGNFTALRQFHFVKLLPRTKSGKIIRSALLPQAPVTAAE
jgi:propionyl-CoA synthetase